jgi:hypothetical protein
MCRLPLLWGFTVWVVAASAQGLPVSFNAPRSYPVLGAPVAIVAGDFNGDGLADLAVAYNLTRTVAIQLATSDGGFQPPVEYRVGQEPKSLAVGDFNRDGKLDLVVANRLGFVE